MDNRVNDFAQVLDDIGTACLIGDEAWQIIWMNREARHRLPNWKVGMTLTPLFDDDVEQYKHCIETVRACGTQTAAIAQFPDDIIQIKGFLGEDGRSYFIWKWLPTALTEPSPQPVVVSEQMDQIMAEYRSNISDIQNLLGSIQNILEHDGRKMQSRLTEYVAQSCHRMTQTTINVGAYFRYHDQKQKLKPQLVSLKLELQDMVRQINHMLIDTGRKIELAVNGNDFFARIDPYQFYLALLNALNNSLKYGLHDSPILVRLFRENNDILIQIHNGGDGMTPECIQQAFDAFYSYNPITQRKDGVGIGLFLVRQIMQAHGGWAIINSEKNEGTTLTLRLPAAELLPGNAAMLKSNLDGNRAYEYKHVLCAFLANSLQNT